MMALNRMQRPVNGSHVLLLGLAYRPNIGDSRESPALVVTDLLMGLGAQVNAVDPYIDPPRVDARIGLVDLDASELAWADAVVALTDHDAFDWDLIATRSRFLLDTRCRLTGAHVEHL